MPEYVYGLHEFVPENEDEVPFRAGERIEVVEKDDIYQDGWWKGRNLAGTFGLFPVSYTTQVAPAGPPIATQVASSSLLDNNDYGQSHLHPGYEQENSPIDLSQKTVLNTLTEESESGGSPRPGGGGGGVAAAPDHYGIIAPIPKAATPSASNFLNGHHNNNNHHDDDFEPTSNDEEEEAEEVAATKLPRQDNEPAGDQVMKATLTDVQKAIEQLGRRNRGDSAATGASDLDDGNRSFSFASTGGDREDTDTDFDLSDIDGAEGGEDDVEGWHKGARMKLAEKARRAIEEAEKMEAIMGGGGSSNGDTQRAIAPPIEVEMSDESDDEEEREGFTSRSTAFQGIPEEPEEDETDGDLPTSRGGRKKEGNAAAATTTTSGVHEDTAVSLVLPEKDETQTDTATATRSSFQLFHSPPPARNTFGTPPPPQPAAVEPEVQPRSSTSSPSSPLSRSPPPPQRRSPGANRTYHHDHDIKPSSPSPVPFPSPPPEDNTQTQQRVITPQPPPPPHIEGTPTIPTIPTNFFRSVSHTSPPATGTAVSSISRHSGSASTPPVQQQQLRAVSPPSFSNADQTKHASVGSSTRNSGGFPPVSPEPTSPLPPIPATVAESPVPVPVQLQAANSTMTSSTTIRPVVSPPPPITTTTTPASHQHHVPPPVIVPPTQPQQQHPSEWTLDQVISWLKSKNFDQDVCDKFTEQEITGDVLLELDVQLLKSEIGIMAFGKRVRISNAITELRTTATASATSASSMMAYSVDGESGVGGQPSPAPGGAVVGGGSGGQFTPLPTNSQIHSRTPSQSHHSFAGSSLHGQQQQLGGGGHTYSQSIQSSLGSPLGFTGPGGGLNGFNGAATANILQSGRPFAETPSPVGGEYVDVSKGDQGGLGGSGDGREYLKPRPTQLSLSPSDGALKAHAAEVKPKHAPAAEGEDRGHMSDGDAVPASRMRRRLFGRSQDSAGSSRRQSKDMSPMASPTTLPDPREKEKDKESVSSSRHGKGKRSMDAGKGGGERLSIFGGTFGGALNKGRKPPPSAEEVHTAGSSTTEKTSLFSLPRLHAGSVRKSSSTHPSSTPNSPPSSTLKDFGEISPKQEKTKTLKERDSVLRKRTVSSTSTTNGTLVATGGADSTTSGFVKSGQSILDQIGEPDHVGWMRKKGDRYNAWKSRYFVLKGPHMYCLRSDNKAETKIKGYIHIVGYKVSVDENLDPGRYGFRIDHEHDKTHYFSSDEKGVVRDWMKAIMKATIDRDYTKPVVSSCNIPTIPLTVAQAMNPAPRPPSPTARAATQKALRRGDPNQLSTRDAQILMGLSSSAAGSANDLENQHDLNSPAAIATRLAAMNPGPAPPRPSRDVKRSTSIRSSALLGSTTEDALIDWANSYLPPHLQIRDTTGPLFSGLALLRLAESVKGMPSSPPVPDSAFPVDASDEKLDGLFRLFDFLLDNDVKMGSVSINDVRQGKRDKILQLLKALKAWEDKKRAILQSVGRSVVQAGGFIGN